MHRVFARVMLARSMAAAISLATTVFALVALPASEYATASLAISFASVGTTLFYTPFSRFALIEKDTRAVESVFWFLQPFLLILCPAVSLVVFAVGEEADRSLIYGAASFFIVAQGMKFFCGDLARKRGELARMERLYLYDAVTTLAITVAFLPALPTAWMFLLTSGASSLFWSLALGKGSHASIKGADLRVIRRTYGYAVGPLASGALNGIALSSVRASIVLISTPQIAAAAQFVLDLLQKVMALLSSSLTSAALPEVVVRGSRSVLAHLLVAMAGALLILAVIGAVAYGFASRSAMWAIQMLPMACAFFVWSNRYKSTTMELPLLAHETRSGLLVVGSIVSLLLVLVCCFFFHDVEVLLLMSAASLLLGGMLNLHLAKHCSDVDRAMILSVCAPPMAVCLMLLLLARSG